MFCHQEESDAHRRSLEGAPLNSAELLSRTVLRPVRQETKLAVTVRETRTKLISTKMG